MDRTRAFEVLEWLRQQDRQDGLTRSDLESQARRYLELFDLAPGSYLETGVDGVIRLANLATGEMLGIHQDRLAGCPLIEFVSADSREGFTWFLERLRDGEEATGWETRLQPSTGPAVDVFVSVRRGWGGGRTRVLRWLLHDVTERNRRERELAEH